MAITKIHAIKSTLGKALAYIENPDKTDGQMLVSGYNCEPQTASIDFEMTAVLAHKARNLQRKRSTNLAYHLIQSFSPEDAVTPEQAHELGKKLAFEYTGGKYEYVVATHIDKGHIHNHIMINAVSFYDYKKLRTVPYRTARQIRDISDRLCIEAHLSVIDDPQKIGQLYPENAGKKKSVSNRTEIRKRLNFCLERATGYSQFLSMAKELEITPTIRGKHMSYLLEGAGRSVRDNSLSDTDTFTYAGICARLSDNAQEQKYLRRTITGILSTATGMADFADKLKTAGIETKVKKATGQVLYRATVLDGAWVPEDALGSEFTSEGIEYALKNGEMQIAEDAEITLIDRYQELTIQYAAIVFPAVYIQGSAPGAVDVNGCAVSESIALDLFGSTDIVGQTLQIGDRNVQIRGVFQGQTNLAITAAQESDMLKNVELVGSPGGDLREMAVDYVTAAGLGTPDQICTGKTWGNFFVALCSLPLLVSALWLLLVGFRISLRFPSWLRITIWFAVLFVFALLLPYLLGQIPSWLLPAQWSNLGFWLDLVNILNERLNETLSLVPTTRDVFAKRQAIEFTLWLLACLGALGLSVRVLKQR